MQQIVSSLFLMTLILFISQFRLSTSTFSFPRNMWVYWDKPIQNSPILVQLCYQKIYQISVKQDWNLTLLSDENIHKYIKNYDKYLKIKQNAKSPFKQAIADLNRFTILQQYGGIWIDITSILFNGMKWIEEIQNNKQYLITNYNHNTNINNINNDKTNNNSNNTNNDKPEMIAFYTSLFQSKTEYHSQLYNSNNNNYQNIYNYNPGYQMWFLAAQKHSSIISAWLQSFSHCYQQSYYQNHKQFSEHDIWFRHLQQDDYLIGNKANYYLIQQKQKQLDKNNLTLFGQRLNANVQYKIWGLKAEYGPLAFALRTISQPESIMTMTIQQLQQQYFMPQFYIKITQGLKPLIQQQLNNIIQLSSNNITNFTKFITTSPTQHHCNTINFIVEGSILSLLLKQNKIAQKYKIFTISLQQRQQWKLYCQNKIKYWSVEKIMEKIGLYAQNVFMGSLGNREYVELYKEGNQINIIQIVLLYLSMNRLVIVLIILVIIAVFVIFNIIKIIRTIFMKIIKLFNKQNNNNQTNKQNNNNQTNKQNSYQQEQSIILDLSYIFFIITSIILYLLHDSFGQQISQILIILLILSFEQIQNKSHQQQQQKQQIISLNSNPKLLNLSLSQLQTISSVIFAYFIGKLILSQILVRQNQLVCYNVLISLVCLCLLDNIIACKIYLQMIKYIIITFLIMVYFVPNLKYIVYQDQYVIRKIIYLPILFVAIVYVISLFKIVKQSTQLYYISKNNTINTKNQLTSIHNIIQSIIKLFIISIIIYNCIYLRYNFIPLLAEQKRILFQLTIVFLFINLNLINNKNNNNNNKIIQQQLSKVIINKLKLYLIPIIYVLFMMKKQLKYQILENSILQLLLLITNIAYCLVVNQLNTQKLNQQKQFKSLSLTHQIENQSLNSLSISQQLQ